MITLYSIFTTIIFQLISGFLWVSAIDILIVLHMPEFIIPQINVVLKSFCRIKLLMRLNDGVSEWMTIKFIIEELGFLQYYTFFVFSGHSIKNVSVIQLLQITITLSTSLSHSLSINMRMGGWTLRRDR